MINEQTVDILRKMKLNAMANELMNQLNDSNTYNSLGFEERIGLLVDAEWNRRQTNKLNRYIKTAAFSVPGATIEGIEYHEDRKLDKAEILRYATCKYIEDGVDHHSVACVLNGCFCKGLVQQFPFCSIFYRLPTLYQLPERLEKRRGGRKGKIKGRRKVL